MQHVSDSIFQIPSELINKNPKGSMVANQEINYLVKSLKPEIEKESGNIEYDHFEAEMYKSQLINGISYYVKVNIGNNRYIHVKIYKPFLFQHKSITNGVRAACVAVQLKKKFYDEIDYF